MDLNELIEFASASESTAGPDRITELRGQITQSGADPRALENDAQTAFANAYNNGQFSLEDAPALEVLADVTDAARQVAAQQDQVKASIAQRAASLANSTSNDNNAGKGSEPEQEQDSEDEGPAVPRDEQGRFRPNSDDTDEGGEQDNGGQAPASAEQAGQAQSSSRRKVALSSQDLNAERGAQKMPQKAANRSYTITASADTPDTQMGSQLSVADLGSVARTRMNSMPVGQHTEAEVRRSIAQINRVYDENYVVDGANPVRDAQQIDWIADEKRLPGGSLVAAAQQQHEAITAAGGMQAFATPPGDIWCSPSETDYSLCKPLGERVGLLDLPSFQVQRGGIRYPVWKQYPEQHRPSEHGPGDREVSNDQAQGWWPTANPPQDYPYDAQWMSEGPRHDWHGYSHLNRNTIGGERRLEDPDTFLTEPKKSISGPCVEWAEERMHMAYLWIEEDILRNHTYPELAERFMSDALVSHAHYMNETYLRWIAAHSDRLDPFWAGTPGWGGPGNPPRNGIVPPGPMSYPVPVATNNYYPGSHLDFGSYGLYGMGSAAEAVLERVGWLVTWFRDAYRTGNNTTLEGIAPVWFKEFLKVDIERKLNRPHSMRVTDAEVEAAFLTWGCRMQWVYDWQSMPSTEYHPPYDDVMSSHIMPRGGWPNAVDLILYPSGSWVLAEQNIIRLEATYDSNRLRNNKFTSLYMEDAWMLLNRCNRSFIVQLRGLCANGATGEPWQACSPEAVPARREQVKAGDGGAKAPPQMIDGPGNNIPATGGGDDSGNDKPAGESGNSGNGGGGNGGTGKGKKSSS